MEKEKLFEQWLENNNKPIRYFKTLHTISEDLKNINYTNYDLYSINDYNIIERIRNDYLDNQSLFEKNKRGNYMYNSTFNRYIEFLKDDTKSKILNIYPDEIIINNTFQEGNSQKVYVNRFERDKKAREACLKHFGYNCQICNFNFEDVYGNIGTNSIHVHHIIPLAKVGQAYKVNPIRDLIPVCPNCHLILHKKDAPTIEELQQHFKNKKERSK